MDSTLRAVGAAVLENLGTEVKPTVYPPEPPPRRKMWMPKVRGTSRASRYAHSPVTTRTAGALLAVKRAGPKHSGTLLDKQLSDVQRRDLAQLLAIIRSHRDTPEMRARKASARLTVIALAKKAGVEIPEDLLQSEFGGADVEIKIGD